MIVLFRYIIITHLGTLKLIDNYSLIILKYQAYLYTLLISYNVSIF